MEKNNQIILSANNTKSRIIKSRVWFYLFWGQLFAISIVSCNLMNWKSETENIESGNDEDICLMAIYKPKKMIVEKGDYFEADFIVGQFVPNKINNQAITINGARFFSNEEGVVNFKAETNSKGLKELKVVSNFSKGSGISGGKMCGNQSFDYYVIDSTN